MGRRGVFCCTSQLGGVKIGFVVFEQDVVCIFGIGCVGLVGVVYLGGWSGRDQLVADEVTTRHDGEGRKVCIILLVCGIMIAPCGFLLMLALISCFFSLYLFILCPISLADVIPI